MRSASPAASGSDGLSHLYASALAGVSLVSAIHWRESLASTSTFLQGLASSAPKALHGVLAIADHQSAGRGRLGRTWDSPPGQALLFSLALDGQRMAATGLLPAAASVAVAQAIAEIAPGLDPHLKWPNDVLLSGRKVAGILVEQAGDQVVLGIGVNVYQSEEHLPRTDHTAAISVGLALAERGENLAAAADCRPALLAAIVGRLEPLIDPTHGTERTLRGFETLQQTLGRRVCLQPTDGARPVIEGVALAIDTDGALLIRLDHGPTVAVHSGEGMLTILDGGKR